jgi:predicted deacylase
MTDSAFYPIGIPGQPWSAAEIAEWRSRQIRHRSYAADVLSAIERLRARFDVVQYGQLDYPPDTYPLFAIKSRDWLDALPCVLVTGGVHGYETSGVHGALQFVDLHATDYAGRVNLLIAPCVSPWAYERIHRWNHDAIDPNRSFRDNSPAQESAALMGLVAPLRGSVMVHIICTKPPTATNPNSAPRWPHAMEKYPSRAKSPTAFICVATPKTRSPRSSRR